MVHVLAGVAVGMSDQVAVIMGGVGVLEFTPGDSYVISTVLDIDTTVAAVSKCAVVNPNIAGFVNGDTVPIARLVLIAHVQKPEDVVAFFAPEALQIADNMGAGQADDCFVASDANARTAEINIAAYINNVRGLISLLYVVNQIRGVVDCNYCAACSAGRAAAHACPAYRRTIERLC